MNRLRPEISLWVAVAQNREDHCASNETEGELPLSLKGHTILILIESRYTCSNKSWTVTDSCRVHVSDEPIAKLSVTEGSLHLL